MSKTRMLKPVTHTGNHSREIAKHPADSYLCLIYGNWFAGKFSQQWYGWNFNNWGVSGIQLEAIEEVYRII